MTRVCVCMDTDNMHSLPDAVILLVFLIFFLFSFFWCMFRSSTADCSVSGFNCILAPDLAHQEGHQEATGLHSRIQNSTKGLLT